mmetsp:Transcript_61483/g.181703  ORF Transcript_61483/g.181703 Transcript_61483/m.181703 type:complete len:222 (+) Transcript_61483:304-969(+)
MSGRSGQNLPLLLLLDLGDLVEELGALVEVLLLCALEPLLLDGGLGVVSSASQPSGIEAQSPSPKQMLASNGSALLMQQPFSSHKLSDTSAHAQLSAPQQYPAEEQSSDPLSSHLASFSLTFSTSMSPKHTPSVNKQLCLSFTSSSALQSVCGSFRPASSRVPSLFRSRTKLSCVLRRQALHPDALPPPLLFFFFPSSRFPRFRSVGYGTSPPSLRARIGQ